MFKRFLEWYSDNGYKCPLCNGNCKTKKEELLIFGKQSYCSYCLECDFTNIHIGRFTYKNIFKQTVILNKDYRLSYIILYSYIENIDGYIIYTFSDSSPISKELVAEAKRILELKLFL
jgi:hypothetical protein